MQIILTEEEYNKIKSSEKEIYDRAYKDAYDSITNNEEGYLRELTEILKTTFGWQMNSLYGTENSYLHRQIKELQKKYKL